MTSGKKRGRAGPAGLDGGPGSPEEAPAREDAGARTRELEAAIERLRRSEERYSALFTNASAALYVIDVRPDGGFVFEEANTYFLDATGHAAEDLLGKRVERVLPPAVAAEVIGRYRECVATARRIEYEIEGHVPSGYMARRIILSPLRDAEGRVRKIFGSAFDITESRRLAEQLRQSEKMTAIGQLTGGIAHDFNNLLTTVLGNVELVEMRLADETQRRMLQSAMRAAQRGAKLTQQLLAFARKQHLAPKPLELNLLIGGMSEMLARTLGVAVRVATRLDPALWRALVDPNQVELVLLNLAINGRDAMPDGGILTIATRNIGAGDPDLPEDLAPGDYVAIAVSDVGTGMTEEVRARAFEPFFTTKEVGKGSGLGLSQVYGVARQSGGTARIASSSLGEGATVELFLPRAAAATATEPTTAAGLSPGRRALVLVVDDQDDVRDVTLAHLDALGYRAASAASGQAAIDELGKGLAADAVLLDHAMPGKSGAETAQVLRARWPGLPVIFVTGYADASGLEKTFGAGRVLRKPYRLHELSQLLDAAMRRGAH